MDDNLYWKAVEEKIDNDGNITLIFKKITMANIINKIIMACKEVFKGNFDGISDNISKIQNDNKDLRNTLNQQSNQIANLQKEIANVSRIVESLASNMTPIVDEFNASKLRPGTLYQKAVGQFIKINEKFENASSYILRETLKKDNSLISPLTSLLNFLINPNYKIEQWYLSVINNDEQALKAIYEEIVKFHEKCFQNIDAFLKTKDMSFNDCVKLLDGNEYLSGMMEYHLDSQPSSSGKVFVLSLYYNFPETDACEHKAKVYPNELKD